MRHIIISIITIIILLVANHIYIEDRVFSSEIINQDFDTYRVNHEVVVGELIDDAIEKPRFRDYKNYLGTIRYLDTLVTLNGYNFVYLGNYAIVKDDVFFLDKKLTGIDADTFRIHNYGTFISDKSGYYVGILYADEENQNVVTFFTGSSLTFFEDSFLMNYAVDGNDLYFLNRYVEGANAQNVVFYPGQGSYYTDGISIYYVDKSTKVADQGSFIAYPLGENIYDRDAEDKNHKYLRGEIVEVKSTDSSQ